MVEIARGSKVKYELDKASGLIKVCIVADLYFAALYDLKCISSHFVFPVVFYKTSFGLACVIFTQTDFSITKISIWHVKRYI